MNPSYAVVDVDAETLLPLNFQIYYLDIEKANKSGEDHWELYLDYVRDYRLNPAFPTPDAMHDLAMRVMTERPFASLFLNDMSRGVGAITNVDPKVQRKWACVFATSESWESDECQGKKNHTSLFHSPADWLFNWLIGNWVVKSDSKIEDLTQ